MKFVTQKSDKKEVRLWLDENEDGSVMLRGSDGGMMDMDIMKFKNGKFERSGNVVLSGVKTNGKGQIWQKKHDCF